MPKWAHKDEDECDNGGNITRFFFFFCKNCKKDLSVKEREKSSACKKAKKLKLAGNSANQEARRRLRYSETNYFPDQIVWLHLFRV